MYVKKDCCQIDYDIGMHLFALSGIPDRYSALVIPAKQLLDNVNLTVGMHAQ